MKRLSILLLSALCTAATTFAYDFQSGDLYYNITSENTVEVTCQVYLSLNNYRDLHTDTVIIPETITYNGRSYSVTSIGTYAFFQCTSFSYVTIPESVTDIGDGAFSRCSFLRSITIPNSVTSIDGVFSGCSRLTSITIPNSVTSIGGAAFSGCSSLTSISIPNAVTSIGEKAFMECTSLTSISIPDSVTSIGKNAFYGCSSITSINIPNSVTNIGYAAFWGCSSLPVIDSLRYADTYLVEAVDKSLSTYTIKAGTKWIGTYAFRNCSSLTSITIPDSVTSIGDYAFRNCSSLTSITVPNSVTSIGDYAFNNCSSLTSITIPNSVMSIGIEAFSSCSSLPVVDNLRYADTYLVEAVDKSLSTYTIKAGTKWIGTYAFRNCSSLTSITIPDSVTSIGDYAFYGCSSLTSITIPNSVTSIGDAVFYGCSSLTSITIGNSLTSIGFRAFYKCNSLTSVLWNAKNCGVSLWTISGIGYCGPFEAISSNITSFTFGEEVETIPAYLCFRMTNLTSITIPNSVTSIGELAFFCCSSLTSATIGNSVTSIGEKAFYLCSSLTSITIPNSVTSIGPSVFSGCSSLTSVIWNAKNCGVTLWSTGYEGNYDYFYGPFASICSQITSFTFGEEVETIPAYLCYGMTSLTSVTIPNFVTSIGKSAFNGCTSLRNITCLAVTPPTCEDGVFNDVPNDATLWCPCEGIEAYQTTDGWSRFKNTHRIDFPKITLQADNKRGRAQIDELICAPQSVVISATPNSHYVFTRWSDGNTENPRTVLLTQDTTLTAEFGLAYSGKCGDNLYWEYKDKALTITGSGTMYNYTKTTMPWLYLRDSIYSVPLPKEITSIGSSAFEGCSALTSITIPNSVTSIGKSAFYGCSALTRTNYTGDIAGWCALQFDNETANPTYYSKNLFISDVEIKGSQILNSITSIGQYAFYNCSSISSVTLGNSVTSIGNSAFYKCSLADIYCYATTPPVCKTNTFNGVSKNCYIHVPTGTVRSYQLATGWSDFNYFFEISEEQALPATQQDNQPSRKIIRNGQVLIIRNGETYDMMGQRLQ